MTELLKYLTVYALAGFKFIFGPTIGLSYGYSVLVTACLTLAGMMSTVYLFCFFGPQIRQFTIRLFGSKRKRVFTKRNRRFVKIWSRYGVKGIAFLTPILLSPPIGTILANAFGGHRKEIIKWMWIFGAFFSFLITYILKNASDLVRDLWFAP